MSAKTRKPRSGPKPKHNEALAELVQYAALDVRELGRLHQTLWESHTHHAKQCVLEALERTSSRNRCVVVGAGPCYDIPLMELAQHFEVVELVDLNPASMEQAVLALPDDLASKVVCRFAEVTHSLPKVLHAIKQEMIRAGTRSKRAANKAITLLKKAQPGHGEWSNIKGDLLISDMILSQLPTALWLIDDWYESLFGTSIMEQPGWAEAMGMFKEKLQNAHINGLFQHANATLCLLTDFGVASSEEDCTLEAIAAQSRITLAGSTLETLYQRQEQASFSRSWTWHRDDSPPKYSPVWGMVFTPEASI
ncbi:MAG: hypothetical protein EP343_10460 [Deltaproteobacteria bacterium]|nr:MAG: hypothetical protein EP343_10460 [Deltaproteobacteria bacterium]